VSWLFYFSLIPPNVFIPVAWRARRLGLALATGAMVYHFLASMPVFETAGILGEAGVKAALLVVHPRVWRGRNRAPGHRLSGRPDAGSRRSKRAGPRGLPAPDSGALRQLLRLRALIGLARYRRPYAQR
jgi:hypothetical protein